MHQTSCTTLLLHMNLTIFVAWLPSTLPSHLAKLYWKTTIFHWHPSFCLTLTLLNFSLLFHCTDKASIWLGAVGVSQVMQKFNLVKYEFEMCCSSIKPSVRAQHCVPETHWDPMWYCSVIKKAPKPCFRTNFLYRVKSVPTMEQAACGYWCTLYKRTNATMLTSYTKLIVAYCCSECCVSSGVELRRQWLCGTLLFVQ